VGHPLQVRGSVVANIDAAVTGTFAVPPTDGFTCVFATENATVDFHGGTFQNVAGNLGSGEIFLASGDAKLTIDATVIDTAALRAISMFNNASVVLKNSQIHRVSLPVTGDTVATIFMGGQGGALPINQKLEVLNSDITQNQVNGISAVVYDSFASKPIVKFTNSHIDNNTGSGFIVSPMGGVHSGVVNTVQVVDSTFKANTLSGITMPSAP
jgi:hypothetical protein